MKEATFTGHSKEEALLKASQELGVNISDMTYDVIEEETGLFGLFRRDVKVLVRVKDDAARVVTRASYVPGPGDTGLVTTAGEVIEFRKPDVVASSVSTEESRPASAESVQTQPAPSTPSPRPARPTYSEASESMDASPSSGSAVEKGPDAARVLKELLDHMGFDCEVSFEENDESVLLNLAGPDCDMVVGKEGDVMSAVQFLVNKIINRFPDDRKLVVLDSDGFRGRREQTLGLLARRLGDKAVETGRVVRLSPMTAQDRRLIHLALRDNRKVSTRSEGVGDFRRLLIIPAGFETGSRERPAAHDSSRRGAPQGQMPRRNRDHGRNA